MYKYFFCLCNDVVFKGFNWIGWVRLSVFVEVWLMLLLVIVMGCMRILWIGFDGLIVGLCFRSNIVVNI